MKKAIPFTKPYIYKNESQYLLDVLKSSQWSGDRTFSKKCESFFKEKYGFLRTLLTPSCTAALELMALLIELKAGDEVIIPSYTFPTTASAMALRGATPRFVDVDPKTLNITLDKIKEAHNENTKAVLVVHYGGYACDIEAIASYCKEHNLYLFEDAAQCIHSFYKEKPLGSFGDLGAISFHETKNISCGEGGALFINNPKLVENAEIIREKGTDRSKFLRGEIDKYSWKKIGSSFLLSEFNSAVLLAQLEGVDEITRRRTTLWDNYYSELKNLSESNDFTLPKLLENVQGNGHIFWMTLKDDPTQSELQNYLKDYGITATSHFVPLHESDAGRKFGKTQGGLNLTKDLANRVLRLPLFYELTDENQNYIIEKIKAFFKK